MSSLTRIVNGMLIREERVLIAKRSSERQSYPSRWSFPGGHVEPSEAMDAALIRELREEISVTPVDYGLFSEIDDPNTRAGQRIVYSMYLVTAWKGGEPIMQGTEHSELRWLHPREALLLADLALPDYQQLFERLSRRTSVAQPP
ncbi:MAG: NUDIX domain-containing protein [Pseudomonadota bacterium]